MIYLDYAATTPVNEDVLKSFVKVSKDFWGNPSSMHKLGTRSTNLLNQSKEHIQKLLDTSNQIIFTSGATESNNLAIKGITESYSNRGRHIISSTIEHPSVKKVLESLKDFEITYLKPINGIITKTQVKEAIRDDTILVSLMHVNNEIGNINPIEEIAKYLDNHPQTFFHVDATQSVGKIKLNLNNIDLLSFSAHKLYGMKGSGALIIQDQINLQPQIIGGGQENNLRSGTENIANAVALAKAIRLAKENSGTNLTHVLELNKYLRTELKTLNLTINSRDDASPYILNFSLNNIQPETMLHYLEEKGIYISTTSACASRKNTSSVIIQEITDNQDLAAHSLRISISYLTTKEELDTFIEELTEGIEVLN